MTKASRTTAFLVGILVWVMLGGAAQAAQLTWWSHWATEENKKEVLFEVKKRFEAKHPGNTVTITFYEKVNMWPVLRATFTAGTGFPDVFYFDTDVTELIATGWLADLSNAIRWENMEQYGKAQWTQPGPGGKMGVWAIAVEAGSDELYYNKKLFRQLGITVPANYAFTQDEFKEVMAKCVKGGYAAFATGTADRDWTALYMPTNMLLSKLGNEDLKKLARGEMSWKDPRVVDVFRYYKELIDMGAYSRTMTSMTLAEAHRYFHTEQKACMFPVGSFYAGRAFVPPEKGGQPKDFELGFLNYPLMKDGKGYGEKLLGAGGGSLAVAAKGPNLPLALQLVDTFADIEIGNMWMAKVGNKTGIKTDPARITGPLKGYLMDWAEVNKNNKWVTPCSWDVKLLMKPGVWEVWVATVQQGLPNKLIGPDEALDKMEAARLKFK